MRNIESLVADLADYFNIFMFYVFAMIHFANTVLSFVQMQRYALFVQNTPGKKDSDDDLTLCDFVQTRDDYFFGIQKMESDISILDNPDRVLNLTFRFSLENQSFCVFWSKSRKSRNIDPRSPRSRF